MAAASVNYETLLRKSNQDDLLKNWGLTLSLYLNDFMAHFQEQSEFVNFSEAAMLLQNSTTFYCKRVDVVHKIFQELLTEVNNLRKSNDNEENKKNAQKNSDKRKRGAKSLEMDDLQPLDLVASEHSMNIPDQKIEKLGVLKQIVLNTAMKALRKGGTSVPVYQITGNLLGCKEEFKIYGNTYMDGTIRGDLDGDDEKMIYVGEEECEATVDFDDLRDESYHENIDNMEPEPQQELSTQIPEASALPISPSLPITTREYAAATKPRRKKNFDWEPIPIDCKVTIRPLKVANLCIIPKQLLESDLVEEPDELSNKGKKRKRKNKKDENAECSVHLTWIDIAIKDGSINSFERRVQEEILVRKELLKGRRKNSPKNIFDEPDDLLEGMDDHDNDDFEDLVDDHDAAVSTAPLNRVDEMIRDESTTNLYADEALKAIEKFKEIRREHASRATEVAKRVAAWHESIMPVLEAAETRSKFDVHEYGSRILSLFPDDDLTTFRPFQNVVVEQPLNEICRYFLSTLMLANTYNLEIRKGEPGPLVKDCVELKLITKVRHHEEMDEALRVASEDCGS